jgi:hypothetical protein
MLVERSPMVLASEYFNQILKTEQRLFYFFSFEKKKICEIKKLV